MRKLHLILVVAFAAAFGANAIGGDARVDYPSGYRSWQHVKSMIIQPGHPLEGPFGGIHHIYANARALSGLSSGEYKDGAVFVFDLLGYEENDNTIVETARKRVDVMQYNREKFSKTGGWGFDTFAGDSKTERLVDDGGASCFACHTSAKASSYVFSQYRP